MHLIKDILRNPQHPHATLACAVSLALCRNQLRFQHMALATVSVHVPVMLRLAGTVRGCR